MHSDDLQWGVKTTLAVAHHLHKVLGRIPSSAEIRWRTATQIQARFPSMTRKAAMQLADQMMDAVRDAHELTTT